MTTFHAVIGAALGDEGKGNLVNFLAKKYPQSIVVRHNGSCQAGHTVTLPSGIRHVFHHVASGALQGCPTYLGPDFVCNPILFNREMADLTTVGLGMVNIAQSKYTGPNFNVFVHPHCYVTTPYDMMINQAIEMSRNSERHGSCGVGFGETIERNESLLDFGFMVRDLRNMNYVKLKVEGIRKGWAEKRLSSLFRDRPMPHAVGEFVDKILQDDGLGDRFLVDCQKFLNRIQIAESEILLNYPHVIFEGAQGLMLDQESEFFPHVTRSYTGTRNIATILDSIDADSPLEVTYIMRPYLTRHGAGPLPGELSGPPYPNIRDDINVKNDFQGSLRFAYMDIDLVSRFIKKDLTYILGYRGKVDANIAITCLDQLPYDSFLGSEHLLYIVNGMEYAKSKGKFFRALECKTDLPIRYRSYSPLGEFI